MSHPDRRHFLHTSGGFALTATTAFGQSPPPTKIKVAQIGTKHSHASGKLSTLLDLDELYEVVGVCEDDQEQRERVSSKSPYKDCRWMPRDEILKNTNIQLITVETEIDQLMPTAIQCLQAGKHIHLDKPAGQTLAPCRAIYAEATKRGLTIQMGYMLRYNPAFEFLFHALDAGWLGQITEVHGHMGKQASPNLRKELSQYPGGGLFELACHLIDALITVLGKPEAIESISLQTQEDAFRDNQLATFRYANALATIGSNHNDPFGGPRRQFTVIGTEGSIEIRPLEPPTLILSLKKANERYKRGRQEIALPKSEGRYHREFRDFAKIIQGEKALAWDAQHDLIVQETLLKACGLSLK